MKNNLINGLPRQALVCCLIFIFSCDNDDHLTRLPSIAGNYRLLSARTDQGVDLNNDGLVSNDLVTEIDEFDFQFIKSYLEVRPRKHNNTSFKFISIPFPHPNFLFGFPEDPNGFMVYTTNFINGTGYRYDYNEKTKIISLEREDNAAATEATWGRLEEIKVKQANILELEITKSYYDFHTAQLLTIKITALYENTE